MELLIQNTFMKRECYELLWPYTERAVAVQYSEVLNKYQIHKMNNVKIDGCDYGLGLSRRPI